MSKRNRGGPPPQPIRGTVADVVPVRDHNRSTPTFCLHHVQPGFDVTNLDKAARAAFALSLQQRAKMVWRDILMAPRHGLGSENLPRAVIKAPIPARFEDADEFMALRYSGKLPMVGVRSGAVFHIVWIERQFGELYDH
jgi:hypothetical protein